MSNQNVVALITARGGSKGLPQKNIRLFGGLPLIGWTIRAAIEAQCIDRVIVSTDDVEIASISRDLGAEVPFMRPAELASDTATSIDVLQHALDYVPHYERAVLLQPTSPFRTATDIDAGYALWRNEPTTGGCVSVCRSSEPPWTMYTRSQSGCLVPVVPVCNDRQRRQDFPETFLLNGAFYFFKVGRFWSERRILFEDSLGFEMSMARSIDIDTKEDFVAGVRQIECWGGKIPNDDA